MNEVDLNSDQETFPLSSYSHNVLCSERFLKLNARAASLFSQFPVIRIPVIFCRGIFATGCVVQIVLFAKMCFEPHLESFVIPYVAVFTAFVAGFHKEREGAFIVS